jgi:hypothetical protein
MSFVSVIKSHIEYCLRKAEAGQSKITDEILHMDGMTGKMTRHFYNNLLDRVDPRYLEIGTWKGSSTCSAMCGNKAKVVCIDNFSEFDGPRDEFHKNFNKYKGDNDATFIESDCFQVDVSKLPKFNIYMYDGFHLAESHYKALVHFYDCLDDIFIFIVDDWNWDYVREGTFSSFEKLGLKKLYEKEIFTPGNCTKNTWWNGIYIAILQK